MEYPNIHTIPVFFIQFFLIIQIFQNLLNARKFMNNFVYLKVIKFTIFITIARKLYIKFLVSSYFIELLKIPINNT
jgi:hypothetical protein